MGLATLLQPRLCELGKIKIGRKEEKVRKTAGGKEWRAPEKLDHFILTTMQRNSHGDLVQDAALMAALGARYADEDGKLRQVPITLLSDDPEDCMQSAWVWYNGKKIAARSDGETLTCFVDPKTGESLDPPRVSEWKPEYADLKRNGAALFKLHTAFNCVITSGDSKWGGVYRFRTTSRITADQLYGSLVHLRQLTGGILRGLPLMLVVRPLQVAPDGKPTTVYVVHVELRGADLQAIQQQALQMAQFQLNNAREMHRTQIEFRKLLRAPGEGESEVEIADVAEEFHPEAIAGEPVASVEAPDPLAAQMGLEPPPADATDIEVEATEPVDPEIAELFPDKEEE